MSNANIIDIAIHENRKAHFFSYFQSFRNTSWTSVWLIVLEEDQVSWAEHCRYRLGAVLAWRGGGRGAKHG